MKATVVVRLKTEVLDPQGDAVRRALGQLGFEGVKGVRVGKIIEIEIDDVAREGQGGPRGAAEEDEPTRCSRTRSPRTTRSSSNRAARLGARAGRLRGGAASAVRNGIPLETVFGCSERVPMTAGSALLRPSEHSKIEYNQPVRSVVDAPFAGSACGDVGRCCAYSHRRCAYSHSHCACSRSHCACSHRRCAQSHSHCAYSHGHCADSHSRCAYVHTRCGYAQRRGGYSQRRCTSSGRRRGHSPRRCASSRSRSAHSGSRSAFSGTRSPHLERHRRSLHPSSGKKWLARGFTVSSCMCAPTS